MDVLWKQGELIRPEVMYRRVFIRRGTVLGLEHTFTLDAAHDTGNYYADQGKYVEAESMYKRAVEGKRKVLGDEHTSTGETTYSMIQLKALRKTCT